MGSWLPFAHRDRCLFEQRSLNYFCTLLPHRPRGEAPTQIQPFLLLFFDDELDDARWYCCTFNCVQWRGFGTTTEATPFRYIDERAFQNSCRLLLAAVSGLGGLGSLLHGGGAAVYGQCGLGSLQHEGGIPASVDASRNSQGPDLRIGVRGSEGPGGSKNQQGLVRQSATHASLALQYKTLLSSHCVEGVENSETCG